METPDLFMISISALIAVFVLLITLAALMKAITTVFPQKESSTDQALLAAIHTAYQMQFPGTTIKSIEEVK